MKFRCTRTSLSRYDETSKPLPECYGHSAPEDPPFGACDEAEWWIDVPDIDALMALVRREGEIVISPGHDAEPRLEIYDYYRE